MFVCSLRSNANDVVRIVLKVSFMYGVVDSLCSVGYPIITYVWEQNEAVASILGVNASGQVRHFDCF